jgi:hypothetical protein
MYEGYNARNGHDETDDSYTVINCLPHDVYIATPAGLVALPSQEPPELLYRPASSDSVNVSVPGDSRIKVSLDSHEGMIVFGSSNVPPIQANTIYLVSIFALEQFPDRHDFVIANTWPIPDDDKREVNHVLVGITRDPFAVVGVKGLEDLPDYYDDEDTEDSQNG